MRKLRKVISTAAMQKMASLKCGCRQVSRKPGPINAGWVLNPKASMMIVPEINPPLAAAEV
jgi:hypothetical protein